MKLRPVLLSDEIGGGDYHTKIKVTLYNFLSFLEPVDSTFVF